MMFSQTSSSQSQPDDLLSLLSPQQRRDLDTLSTLVSAELGENFTKGDLVVALRDATWDSAKAFLQMKKRLQGIGKIKREFPNESEVLSWKRPRNHRLSLPAMPFRRTVNGRVFTPLQPAREIGGQESYVSLSAPSRIDTDMDEFPIPYSQSDVSDSQETQISNDTHEYRESDPTFASNILMKNLSNRLNPSEDSANFSLDTVLDKMAVYSNPTSKSLLEAACVAHASAVRKNAALFDPTEGSNMLIDIISLLPHIERLDTLNKKIQPSESALARSDAEASAEALAPLPTPEDKIKVLNNACNGHIRRLLSFRSARGDLEAMHDAVTQELKAKLADIGQWVQDTQQHATDKAAALQTSRHQEEDAAKNLQDLVQARAKEFIANGLNTNAALIRAQTVVFTSHTDVEAVTFRELHAAAERVTNDINREWEDANLVDAFCIAVQGLLRHVVSIRKETMVQAFNEFYVNEAQANTQSTQQLKLTLPRLVQELVQFDSALIERIQHASNEVEMERSRLTKHFATMGNSAPTRRLNIEASIDEFENAVNFSKDLLTSTATEQVQLWTSLEDVASMEVRALLKSECAKNWMYVEGPLREVFQQFANSSGPSNGQIVEKKDVPANNNASIGMATIPNTAPTVGSVDEVVVNQDTIPNIASVPPTSVPKYTPGQILYTRISEDSFTPCQVIEFLPQENKYSILYEDNSIYNVAENHLFTENEFQLIQEQARLYGTPSDDEPTSKCCVM